MILADTSVWDDHFRTGEPALAKALEAGTILSHPFVIGEVALGHIRARERFFRIATGFAGRDRISYR